MKSIREDNPSFPSHIAPKVPVALQKACLKSLSKPFDDRYDSSEDLASDLRSYLNTRTAPLSDDPLIFRSNQNETQVAQESHCCGRCSNDLGQCLVGVCVVAKDVPSSRNPISGVTSAPQLHRSTNRRENHRAGRAYRCAAQRQRLRARLN